MLVAVVIDAEWFDSAFDQIVSTNAEGGVVASDFPGVVGVPLTEERIDRLLSESPMQSAGAALLRLACAATSCCPRSFRRRDPVATWHRAPSRPKLRLQP